MIRRKHILLVCSYLCLSAASHAQYRPDTAIKKRVPMNEVMIKSGGYDRRADSLDDRRKHRRDYTIGEVKPHRNKRRKDDVRPGLIMDDVVTSLVNRVSGRTRRAVARIAKREEERQRMFVDTRYTPPMVSQLTGLKGDTLAYFMNAYPMSFSFAQEAPELEFKMWVRTNYREWRAKGSPVPVISPAH